LATAAKPFLPLGRRTTSHPRPHGSRQDELLFLPLVTQGRDPIHDKQLHRVCAETDWRKQRQLWSQLKSRI
jgi:hypothetical protein